MGLSSGLLGAVSASAQTAPALLRPSSTVITLGCGQVLDRALLGSATLLELKGKLDCRSRPGSKGLVIAASQLTVDLAGKPIIGLFPPSDDGTIGIEIAAGANGVLLKNARIEGFATGIADGGNNSSLRLDRAAVAKSLTGVRVRSPRAVLQQVSATRCAVGIRLAGAGVVAERCTTRRSFSSVPGVGFSLEGPATGREGAGVGLKSSRSEDDGTGLLIQGDGHVLESNEIARSQQDGVVLNGSATVIHDLVVDRAERHGVVVTGRGNQIDALEISATAKSDLVIDGDDNHIDNSIAVSEDDDPVSETGVVIRGRGNRLTRTLLAGKGGVGVEISGDGNSLERVEVEDGSDVGFEITSRGNELRDCRSKNNAEGIRVTRSGSGNRISGSEASRNAGRGFSIIGSGNVLTGNRADANDRGGGRVQYHIEPQNLDGGGNRNAGAGFRFDARGGEFVDR